MRLTLISPTSFAEHSVIGGAERYTWELARALARAPEVQSVTFLTWGPQASLETRDGVEVHCLRWWGPRHPLMPDVVRPALFRAIRQADAVHAFQVDVLSSNLAVLAASRMGVPVFVSDLGGGYGRVPSTWWPVMRRATGYLLISEYSRMLWEAAPAFRRPDRLDVIWAGVDTNHFTPGGPVDPSLVVYVGRLVAHKGVEHLIAGLPEGHRLHVIGRPYDQAYFAYLRDHALGKAVTFEQDLDDAQLLARLQQASVAVLPSVATDYQGRVTQQAELFGLAAAEAMACGTPAIVSRTASLPEVVDDGVTGYVVPPADPAAIGERITRIARDPGLRQQLSTRARARVLERFTWDATAARCLTAYRTAGAGR